MTITEFLLARIEEDEADPWRGAEMAGADRVVGPAEHAALHADEAEWEARALAECKAKRAIVELHERWPVLVETPPTFDRVDSADVNSMAFRASRQIAWQTEQEYRVRFGSEPPTAPMIQALADIYADHPDYDTWNLNDG